MIMQDKLEKERNDAKNNVEEYVYEMRDKLHGILEKFVNEAVSMALPRGSHVWTVYQYLDGPVTRVNTHLSLLLTVQDRDAFSLKLEDTETWLYEEGEDQQKQVYIDKLAELKVPESNKYTVFVGY